MTEVFRIILCFESNDGDQENRIELESFFENALSTDSVEQLKNKAHKLCSSFLDTIIEQKTTTKPTKEK